MTSGPDDGPTGMQTLWTAGTTAGEYISTVSNASFNDAHSAAVAAMPDEPHEEKRTEKAIRGGGDGGGEGSGGSGEGGGGVGGGGGLGNGLGGIGGGEGGGMGGDGGVGGGEAHTRVGKEGTEPEVVPGPPKVTLDPQPTVGDQRRKYEGQAAPKLLDIALMAMLAVAVKLPASWAKAAAFGTNVRASMVMLEVVAHSYLSNPGPY